MHPSKPNRAVRQERRRQLKLRKSAGEATTKVTSKGIGKPALSCRISNSEVDRRTGEMTG